MIDPSKTTINAEAFKDMSLPEFKKFWRTRGFDGDPLEYYTKWTGKKLPKKKAKDTE